MSTNASRTFQATPRQLQEFMTVAALQYEDLIKRTSYWPERQPGWGLVKDNAAGLMYFIIFWMFSLMIFPFERLKRLYDVIKRALRSGDWLLHKAERCTDDLLYQCLGHLSASRLGDLEANISLKRLYPRSSPSSVSTTSTWSWADPTLPVTRIAIDERFSDDGQVTTQLTVDLDRPDSHLELTRPLPDWLDLQRDGNHLVLTARGTLDDRYAASTRRARSLPDRDQARGFATVLADILQAAGLATAPDARNSTDPVRLARVDRDALPDIVPDAPRQTPLPDHVEPSYQPGWFAALWRLRAWWGRLAVHQLGCAGIMAVLFGWVYLGIMLLPFPAPDAPGNFIVGASGLLALIIGMYYLARMMLPTPRIRHLRLDATDVKTLTWEDGVLALDERARVRLDQPFIVHLSRSPADAPVPLLGVELRQRDTDDQAARLRFTVPLDEATAPDLPELAMQAPQIPAEAFRDWVWPLICYRASLQGDPLPWRATSTAQRDPMTPPQQDPMTLPQRDRMTLPQRDRAPQQEASHQEAPQQQELEEAPTEVAVASEVHQRR